MSLLVSKQFLLEIGRVAVLQSHIESTLALVITNLAGVETSVGDALTSPFQYRQLAEVTRSLLELRKAAIGDHYAYVTELLKRTDETNEKRNAFVHSMWGVGANFEPEHASRLKVSRLKVSSKGKIPPRLEITGVSIEEAQALVAKMEEILAGLTYIHPFLQMRPGANRPSPLSAYASLPEVDR
jgi:hypothetical protein